MDLWDFRLKAVASLNQTHIFRDVKYYQHVISIGLKNELLGIGKNTNTTNPEKKVAVSIIKHPMKTLCWWEEQYFNSTKEETNCSY